MTAEEVAHAWTKLQSFLGRRERPKPAAIAPFVRNARIVALFNDSLEFIDVRTTDRALLFGPIERHIGRSAYDILPISLAEKLHRATYAVRRTGEPASFDYHTHLTAGTTTVMRLGDGVWMAYEQKRAMP